MTNQKDQPPLLQTKAWQTLQKDLGEKTFFEETNQYQFLAIKKSIPLGFYLYLPYGPYIKKTATQADIQKCMDHILKLASQENAIFIRIEPQRFSQENQNNSRKYTINQKISNVAQYFSLNQKHLLKTKDLNPAETWYLDLTQETAIILSNFTQGTRTRHNTYQKKGLTVEITKNPEDIKYLVELQHQLAKEKHIASFSEKYLKTELSQPFASLFLVRYHQTPENQTKSQNERIKNTLSTNAKNALVENQNENLKLKQKNNTQNNQTPKPKPKDNEVIAASLFFDYQGTRYYMQSAASLKYRHLPATVALLSYAIFSGKESGLHTLDFWGIAPEDATSSHPWYGFTEFKKSFGGYEKTYAGTYDYILNNNKYNLYRLLRKINRLKRKIINTKD